LLMRGGGFMVDVERRVTYFEYCGEVNTEKVLFWLNCIVRIQILIKL